MFVNSYRPSSGSSAGTPYIDLSKAPYNLVTGVVTQAVANANTAAINTAITTWSGLGVRLKAPRGKIYCGQAAAGVPWSIYFGPGTSDVWLEGEGPDAVEFIQQDDGDGGDWDLCRIDRASNCGVSRATLSMGIVKRPDGIQLNHLLNICNTSLTGTGTTSGIRCYNLNFGKTVGDQLRIFGDTAPVTDVRCWDMTFSGAGICIQNWAPSTTYVAGEWVRNDSGKNYICTVGGVSAASGGPTGVAVSGIVDGAATWGYKVAREGARTCISVQRGYRNVEISNFYAIGAQNGILDIEPTSAGGAFLGTEVMEYLNIHDGTLDNTLGDTAVAATFSGITAGAKSFGNRMSNLSIVGGCLSIIQTEQQTIQDVSISVKTLLPNEPTYSNILVRQTNNDLIIRGAALFRGGTSTAGVLIDIEGGNRISVINCNLTQNTVGFPVYFEASQYPKVQGNTIHWTAATPSARSAIYIAAINADVVNPTVTGNTVTTSSTKMLACVELIARTTRKFSGITITGNNAAGFALTGVFMSFQNTPTDVNPVIQGNNFGTDTTWTAESEIAGTAINTIFPIVAGNRGANTARRLEGNVAPGGACIGNLGDIYTYRPTTTSASTYVKRTQTTAGVPDNGGWGAAL